MKLRQARCEFTVLVARLIDKAVELGFQPAGNELKRDPRVALANAQTGAGIANSVHLDGLAIDLLLYNKDGQYLTDTANYRPLGEWWEKQHPLARWGGRFRDGNHFSFEWGGRK